ncbi:hypothetical protein EV195_11015 [Tenacibaculum skagerrakense]|uniref:Cytochrome c n=1 Tax=Tenacibaculum skagerrakense TaxID=186571 RepID=A0A4R2NNK5_9FLAO|nr:hypothetical protein [Tenacibaculum skagerrakense]TCP22888.1 hypothetical protein EV195_11015 [Tenacibaculum skagerrakense]
MKSNISLIIALILTLITTSCETQKEDINKKIKSPNQDSELALLMREMYDEAIMNKKNITNNKPLKINLDHEKILNAIATEPEKAASSEFKAFANSYLQSIEKLKYSNSHQKKEYFENVVNNCMACHQTLCPGPLVRIKKLQ